MPPGAVVKATGWYDNSTKNPANPDATKTVRWGPQTTDEMMLGYLEYYVPAGSGDSLAKGGLGGLAGRSKTAPLFKRIDTNNDGSISREEYDGFVRIIPRFKDNPDEAKALFERLDTDKNGILSLDEFKKLTK